MSFKRNIIFLFLFLIFISSSSTIVSSFLCSDYTGEFKCVETNDPRPTITVTYYEDPADLMEDGFHLFDYYDLSRQIPIQLISSQGLVSYTFQPERVLFDGLYKFTITAIDSDENIQTSTLILAEDIDNMAIWVKNPRIDFIPTEEQKIAIGKKLPFKLTIGTKYPSICRLKQGSEIYSDLDVEFNGMYYYFNKGDGILSDVHTLDVVLDEPGENRSRLELSKRFDYTNVADSEYTIICRQELTENEYLYSYDKLYIGYDDTPFTFESNLNPSTITDNFNASTLISLSAPNERLYCEYNFVDNEDPPRNFENEGGLDFGIIGNPVSEIYQFNSTVSDYLSFQNKVSHFDPATVYPYKINFTCYNPAMWSYSKIVSLNVNISSDFIITFENDGDYFSTNKPELTLLTSNSAVCKYRFDDGAYLDITEKPSRNHIFSPDGLTEGKHDMQVKCSATTTNYQTFTFYTDVTKPSNPNVTIKEYYCGSDFGIKINPMDGEKYISYNVSLYNSTSLIEKNLVYGPQQTGYILKSTFINVPTPSLKDKTVYSWKINAIDKAGNSGDAKIYSTTIQDPNSVFCDFTKPEATVDVNKAAVGYQITVGCKDVLSGCASEYNYSVIGLSESCLTKPPRLKASYSSGALNINEEGKFCYAISDKAGNIASGSVPVAESMEIKLIEPRFGIGSEKTFPLKIETTRDAICKHGYLSNSSGSLEQKYNSLKYLFSETKETKTHQTEISALKIKELDETKSEEEKDWMVICKDGDLYKDKTFKLGFDTSKPLLTVKAIPNPIKDFTNLKTTLFVESDDPVVCTYLDKDLIPTGFPNYDPSNISSYDLNHSIELNYWGSIDTFLQKISCKNIAQNIADKKYEIKTELENTIGLEVTSQEYFNIVPKLEVKTNKDANCEYKLSEDENYNSMTTVGEGNYYALIDIPEGEKIVQVTCSAKIGSEKGSLFTKIVKDTSKPLVEVVTKDKSCSLEKIDFTILTNGTGSPISEVEYTLSDSQGEIKKEITTDREIIINENILEGETYNLKVTVTDMAGNKNIAKRTILGTAFDPLICDEKPPTSKVSVNLKWGGADVTLSCQDDGVGCENFFNYKFEDECQGDYDLEYYENNPLFLDNTATFCYQVFDKYNNYETSAKLISIPNHCFNEIEDPYELGVDCGGSCTAVCGTCDNNKQDLFEEGVDCGGVCATIRSCENEGELEDLNITQDECQSDNDCLGFGEECIAGQCIIPKDNTQIESDKKDSNPLGWILLIFGLLIMGGGGYYIYYTEKKRNEYLTKQQAYKQQNQQTQAPNPQLLAQQKARREEELRKLREKRAKSSELRNQKVEERKNKRSEKLRAFDEAVKDAQQSEIKSDLEKSTNDKESELDNIKPAPKPMDKSKKTVLPKPTGEKQEDYIDLSKKNNVLKQKSDVFGKLKNIGKESVDVQKEKIEIKPKKNIVKKENKKIINPKGSFEALQQFINTVHNDNQKPSEFEHLEHIKNNVSSKEFVDVFTHEVKADRLDETTLIALLKVLIKEKKIDIKTTKEILDKLAKENFIPSENVDVLFAKIN